MHTDHIDQLIEYALVVAGAEDFGRRQLGPIHLIKYVYLGDLAYAEGHAGATYTGAPWRFYHYGPWAEQVFERIAPVIQSVGAQTTTYVSTRYENDAVRYELVDEQRRRALERALPLEIQSAIKRAVHEFGSATPELLHHAYQTKPMIRAAPNERLTFDIVVDGVEVDRPKRVAVQNTNQLSKTAQKRQEERLSTVREYLRVKLQERRTVKHRIPAPFSPRYDEAFFEGVQTLFGLERTPIAPSEGQLEVADDIWKSPSRTESDLP